MGVKAYGLISMDDAQLKALRKSQMAEKTSSKKKPVYFTTNSTLMDLVVGGGEKIGYGFGYMSGSVIRDHAGEGSSKSFKAVECIAANYHKYKDKFRWRYIDVERGNTIDTEALYGVDVFSADHIPSDKHPVATVEQWQCDITSWLNSIKEDECGIYVLDSLDALSSQELEDRKEERLKAYEKGKDYDQGSFLGSSAKFLSQEFFRGLTAKLEEKNCILYIINQERDNMNAGLYGKKYRIGGGRAVGFYESVRVQSKLKNKVEKEGRAVSALIEITAEKTRHPRPYRSCFLSLIFTYGVDSLYDELCFLFDCRSEKTGELLKSSEKIVYKEGVEPMSLDELVDYVYKNKLRKEVREAVIAKWEAIEDSIAIKRPAKFAEDD